MSDSIIRPLRANEIECRVSTINEKGLSLLLYKDARVDQRILDETFGAFGWKRSHQSIDGSLYCTVEIRDGKTGEWVAKQDVGTNGVTEKEKSQASDSFKRACFNWGIGRELYTAPFIWIPAAKTTVTKKGDRFYCSESFSVADIAYNDDREIIGLRIVNGSGKTMYEQKADNTGTDSGKTNAISKKQMASLNAELERTGVAIEAVQDRYQISKPEQMSVELYNRVMEALAKTKSAAAA